MALVRTNITLPKETLALVDAVAGPRGRSRYIAEVVAKQVRRDNARLVFAKYAGALKDSDGVGRGRRRRPTGCSVKPASPGIAHGSGRTTLRYLLDTTVLIDHAKDLHGAPELVESLFSEPNDLYTCDIVVAEALSGGRDVERGVIAGLIRVLEYVSTHPTLPPGPGTLGGSGGRLERGRSPPRSSPVSRGRSRRRW